MTSIEITYLIVLFVIIVVALMYIQKLLAQIEMYKIKLNNKKDNSQMSLAAYERLTLFAERTKIENLITRFYQKDIKAVEIHGLMVQAIKEELEYNLSQQIYVDKNMWDAIVKMKEQNIFILNQVLQTSELQAPADAYIKNLLTITNASENATMNAMVIQAINHEAKTLLK